MHWTPRPAGQEDLPALAALIPLSARVLQAPWYSPAQIEAALGPVFSVDRQLVEDGTYLVVEHEGTIVGCGGWSRRTALFGAGGGGHALDPARDAARIRAFFVHPEWAGRGIGRSLLQASERAIRQAGFRAIELVATLAGEPFYAAAGYAGVERYAIPLPGGLSLPVVRMTRRLAKAVTPAA